VDGDADMENLTLGGFSKASNDMSLVAVDYLDVF